MPHAADDKCQANDQIEDNHDRGHDGIARDGVMIAGAEHDRGDENDFNADN